MIRLQRFLAQAGIDSRRKCEALILAGRVRVNGKVVREMGTRVDPRMDRVHFDGQRVMAEDLVWFALYKPDKVVCTVDDPQGRETVLDVLGEQGVRLFPVGRLDYHTQGLLLLTNDGELAAAVAHPRSSVPRTYHVKVKGDVDGLMLDRLREGVELDGREVKARAMLLTATDKNTWLEMELTTGLNHQIHRMLEEVGGKVLKIIRIAFGPITVEGLRPGRHRRLTQKELNVLRDSVGVAVQKRQVRQEPGGRRAKRGLGGAKRGPGGTKPGPGGTKRGPGGTKPGPGGTKRGPGGTKRGPGGEGGAKRGKRK